MRHVMRLTGLNAITSDGEGKGERQEWTGRPDPCSPPNGDPVSLVCVHVSYVLAQVCA